MMDIEQLKMMSELSDRSIQILINYGYWAIFLGSFFFAESVILAVSFLAASGLWPLSAVFFLALAGDLLADLLWYSGGKYSFRFAKFDSKIFNKAYKTLSGVIDRITRHKPFLALLFIKFLYGTRFLMLIYVARKKVSLKKFLIYDAIGTSIWLAVLLPVGWLAGKGAYNLIGAYRNFNYSILFLVLTLLLYKLFSIRLEKVLIEEDGKIKATTSELGSGY